MTSMANGEHILMVEDDRTIRILMDFGLRRAGYEVKTAKDGSEGMLHLETHQPGLILLDIYMPNMDGIRLLRWIREQERFAHTPIIIISAAEDEEEAVRGIGATEFLAKPVDMVTLLAKVQSLFRKT